MDRYPAGILFRKSDRDDYLVCADMNNAVLLARLNGDVRLSQDRSVPTPSLPDLRVHQALLAAGLQIEEMPTPVEGLSLEQRLSHSQGDDTVFLRNDEAETVLEMLAESEDRAARQEVMHVPTHGVQQTITTLAALMVQAK